MNGKYFTYITWKEGKYYVGQCLNVDISSFGKSPADALESVKEAVDLYLDENTVPDLVFVENPSITLESVY